MGSAGEPPLDPAQVNVATLTATRSVLDRFDIAQKHGLGQHFLIDPHVLDRIVALADIQPGDGVLEVGPGIGALTQALLRAGAWVVAIEQDQSLTPALAYTCEPWKDSLAVLQADALTITAAPIDKAARSLGRNDYPAFFVANLPYNIAASLVLDYLDRFVWLETCTVMVQREVALRMTAQPGTKSYGAYTVKLALRVDAGDAFRVPPSAFAPPPHVDSAVLRLNRRQPALAPDLLAAASAMADAAFFHRRKTIANSMRGYFAGRGQRSLAIEKLLAAADIAPKVRGETLTPETYLALGAAFLAAR